MVLIFLRINTPKAMTNPNTCATGLYLEGFLDHRNVIYQQNNYVCTHLYYTQIMLKTINIILIFDLFQKI